MPSYYEILGVDADAGDEEIQAAYDALLKQCYANLRDPKTHDESIEKIKQLNQARDHLLNAKARQEYDEETSRQELEKSLPPSPWRRFFGRCVDQLIFISLFYWAYRYFADYVFFEDWIFALAAAGVGIALYILLETACVAAFGTTPGKWMLSVLVTAGGQKPGRARLIKRNLIAALYGWALYVPPVSFIALALQYRGLQRPENEGRAPWDRACGATVSYEPLQKYRLWLIAPIALLAVICLANAL
jgi:hypothetical protein